MHDSATLGDVMELDHLVAMRENDQVTLLSVLDELELALLAGLDDSIEFTLRWNRLGDKVCFAFLDDAELDLPALIVNGQEGQLFVERPNCPQTVKDTTRQVHVRCGLQFPLSALFGQIVELDLMSALYRLGP